MSNNLMNIPDEKITLHGSNVANGGVASEADRCKAQRRRNVAQCVLSVAIVAAFWMPVSASAQSCTTFLGNLQSWLVNKPNGPGTYDIAFNMVTNRSDGKYGSYSEGSTGTPGILQYYPAHFVNGLWLPPYLQGDVVQYFSDRRYLPGGGIGFPWAPFDPSATDKTRVTINLNPLGPGFGTVTLTLLSWGNAQVSFPASCQDGLVYGFTGNTMVVMSLNEYYVPLIR